MKTTFKKFLNGLFGLITIKLSLICVILFIQSCTPEELISESQKDLALAEFEQALINNQEPLQNLKSEIILSNTRSSIADDSPVSYTSDEKAKAYTVIEPLIDKSKELLKHYNFDIRENSEILDGENDSRIILIGLMVLSLEKEGMQTASKTPPLFGNSLYAQTKNPYVDCALEALGLNLGFGTIHDLAEEGLEKTVKKMVKKLAWRLLGPIGVAITVAEYAWCLSKKLK